jgi:hypothetical protein
MGRHGCLQLPMQSVAITTNVVSSNPAQARCTWYNVIMTGVWLTSIIRLMRKVLLWQGCGLIALFIYSHSMRFKFLSFSFLLIWYNDFNDRNYAKYVFTVTIICKIYLQVLSAGYLYLSRNSSYSNDLTSIGNVNSWWLIVLNLFIFIDLV